MVATTLSCQKETTQLSPTLTPETAENKEVVKIADRLRFSNRDVFESYMLDLNKRSATVSEEKFLESKETALDFESYRNLGKRFGARRSSESCPLDDEHLASVLNPDGVIQIDKWIIKINLCDKKVFVLDQQDATSELLAEMAKNIPSHEKIRYFSTDQEVLELLEASEPGNRSARLCFSESGADKKEDDDTPYYTGDTRMDCKLRYQKVGIYFALVAKSQSQNQFSGIWWATTTTMGADWVARYEPKCKGEIINQQSASANWVAHNDWVCRPYESTTALHRYKFQAQFFNLYWGISSKIMEINHGY
ncbi:hypothetical protein ACS5NO_10000 [Larkinella sp. GY13]|uniref:hypothetical protein n=1 Tax=Larkinella sp. GY13 TaxID=3453720 RepID=UPI003EEE458A